MSNITHPKSWPDTARLCKIFCRYPQHLGKLVPYLEIKIEECPSRAKWGQAGPNRTKHCQMVQKRAKGCQMVLKRVKRGQTGPKGAMWPNKVKWEWFFWNANVFYERKKIMFRRQKSTNYGDFVDSKISIHSNFFLCKVILGHKGGTHRLYVVAQNKTIYISF